MSLDVRRRDSARTEAFGPLARLALLLFVTVLASTGWYHEIGHDEAQAWNIARTAESLDDILHLSRFEGHTPLWYMVLWPLTRSGEVAWMQALTIALSTSAAYLLLRDRPFGWAGTLLVLPGYYLLYEYAIITRPYVLSLVLGAWFATLYRGRRSRDPLLPGAICAALALVSAYSALLSVSLFVVVVGHAVSRSADAAPDTRPSARRRLVLATCIWVTACALCVWFVVTPIHSNAFASDTLTGGRMARVGLDTLLRTPVLPHLDRVPGATELISTKLGRLLQTFVVLATLIAVAVRLRHDKVLRAAWVVGVVAISAGGFYSGLLSERHLGHLWIAAFVLCWAGACGRGSAELFVAEAHGAAGTRANSGVDRIRTERQPASRSRRLDRSSSLVLVAVLLWHATVGLVIAGYDVLKPLAPWNGFAATVEREAREPYVLLTDFVYEVGATAALLDRPIYDIHCGCFTRYYDWTWQPPAQGRQTLSEAWCDLAAGGTQVVILANLPGGEHDDALIKVADAAPGVRSSSYLPTRVWKLSERERRRCRQR